LSSVTVGACQALAALLTDAGRMEEIMTRTRSLAIVAFALSAAVACSDDSTGTGTSSTVRVVNATSNAVDVASGTTVATGNSNIGFGAGSSCVTTNSFEPDLNVSPTGTTNTYASYAPNFRGGENYVVVAYPGFAGAPEFAYIPVGSAPATGQAGLRVFNAASTGGTYDVYVTAPGAALGTAAAFGIGYRTVSPYISVTPGTQLIRLTNTGTQTVAINAGNQAFTAGQNSLLVIAPPATGGGVPRTFLVTGC
jgi:hypothetical protein